MGQARRPHHPQVVTFDVGTLPNDATAEQLEQAAIFRDTYLHLTSLLSAMAIQALIGDADPQNLIMHNSLSQEPQMDAREARLQATASSAVSAGHMGMASWHNIFDLRGRACSPLRSRCLPESRRVHLLLSVVVSSLGHVAVLCLNETCVNVGGVLIRSRLPSLLSLPHALLVFLVGWRAGSQLSHAACTRELQRQGRLRHRASSMHAPTLRSACAGPAAPRRRRLNVLLPVLGGVTQDEEVAMGALKIGDASVFSDHSDFKGFLLNYGATYASL